MSTDLVMELDRALPDARERAVRAWSDATHRDRVRSALPSLSAAARDRLQALLDRADESAPDASDAGLADALDDAMQRAFEPVRAAVGSEHAVPIDRVAEAFRDSIALYEHLLPRAAWTDVVLRSPDAATRARLVELCRSANLLAAGDENRLASLGLVRLSLPPDPTLVDTLGRLQEIDAVASPQARAGRLHLASSAADDGVDIAKILELPRWAPRELGKNVRIALLGSGLDASHPDLDNYLVADFTGDGRDDELGYGTHLAGLLIGNGTRSDGVFFGLAPLAQLRVAKVADRNGDVSLGALLDGLDWALREMRADLLLLPIEIAGDPAVASLLDATLQAAASTGPILVTAIPEGGSDRSPALHPGVLTVGRLDRAGEIAAATLPSGRSNWGDTGKPEFFAPGTDIVGPRATKAAGLREFDEGGDYTMLSGSAAAAAWLTGGLALVLSAARETHGESITASRVIRPVLQTARRLTSTVPGRSASPLVPDLTAAIGIVQSEQLPAAGTDFRDAAADSPVTTPGGLGTHAADPSQPPDTPATRTDMDSPFGERPRTASGEMTGPFAGNSAPAGQVDVSRSLAAENASSSPGAGQRQAIELDSPKPFPTDDPADVMAPDGARRESHDDRSARDEGRPSRDSRRLPVPSDMPKHATDADTARRLETEFLDGFEARFYNLTSVTNPLEQGKRYDIHSAGETTSFHSDRDELKSLLLKTDNAAGGDMRDYPQNRRIEVALERKRLFGSRQKKVAFVGACTSPMDDLVRQGWSDQKATRRRMSQMVEACIGQPGCFYYLGFFSTTGWSDDAKDANVTGTNYAVFLLECDEEFGFRVYAPPRLDPAVRVAFDPEDDTTKMNRARRLLRTDVKLKSPGGFLLLEEVAENANVSAWIARHAAEEFAAQTQGVRLEVVDQTIIVRRQRF